MYPTLEKGIKVRHLSKSRIDVQRRMGGMLDEEIEHRGGKPLQDERVKKPILKGGKKERLARG